ncbi:MAG: hypothetical protein H8K07_08585, partial [Nitrospira sp.]|nr:hypothetical protein [Nitrospira sp.]
MPPKLSDYVNATEDFVAFEEEFDGLLIPIASNSFEGAGVHDEELAVSRPATPLDLQSIAPPSNWDDFSRVVGKIWEEIDLKDVVLKQVMTNWIQMLSVAENPSVFTEAVGKGYSDYIASQVEGYVDFMKSAISALIDLQQCQFDLIQSSQEDILNILFSEDGKTSLEQAKTRLIQHASTDEKCKLLISIVDAMISLHEAWLWLRKIPLTEIWEEIGHFATVMAELFRRAEIQQTILSLSTDASKLGQLYGTLMGFIIWEVNEAPRSKLRGITELKHS